jgi:hypothetical protein
MSGGIKKFHDVLRKIYSYAYGRRERNVKLYLLNQIERQYFGNNTRSWGEDGVKIHLMSMTCKGMYLMNLVYNELKWRNFENTTVSPSVV